MRTLIFPKQVKFHAVKDINEAEKKSGAPRNMEFIVHDTPIIKGIFRSKTLVVKSELVNEGDDFNLIVSPVGGEFPYGGTNPFRIAFAQSSRSTIVKYTGPMFPPVPPLPMEIFVPGKSRMIFHAEIPLDLYEWEGAPEVSLDWAFYYFGEANHPKGTIKVVLPKR